MGDFETESNHFSLFIIPIIFTILFFLKSVAKMLNMKLQICVFYPVNWYGDSKSYRVILEKRLFMLAKEAIRSNHKNDEL